MHLPIVLALDTSSPHAAFAIARGDTLLASLIVSDGLPHSQTLFENLSRTLLAAGIGLAEIDLFAAATGPGSFTGLRVGLAALQGLADAERKPTLGLDTLSLLALMGGKDGMSLITCAAGRHEIYGGIREVAGAEVIRNLGEDLVGAPGEVIAELRERVEERPVSFVVETGLEMVLQGGSRIGIDRAKQNLAATLALFALRRQESAGRKPLEAHYVRPSDAERKRPQ
ncbi:MAG: tRNA (adenosine(37)-N6)-threonylcarbamoyltransferase complex dimerization subunit type 1 TsaB [Blastocatellia bacterium]|nr:tRNA (adenosine(37)-N6)-threonylcarbamoyltransferase complex dimerization subunit type 1 TsaB [Blastocatellia bacterium]